MPVSYTHLDVYKRQVETASQAAAPAEASSVIDSDTEDKTHAPSVEKESAPENASSENSEEQTPALSRRARAEATEAAKKEKRPKVKKERKVAREPRRKKKEPQTLSRIEQKELDAQRKKRNRRRAWLIVGIVIVVLGLSLIHISICYAAGRCHRAASAGYTGPNLRYTDAK